MVESSPVVLSVATVFCCCEPGWSGNGRRSGVRLRHRRTRLSDSDRPPVSLKLGSSLSDQTTDGRVGPLCQRALAGLRPD
eukprot:1108165-Alexandrium_andersonii.AAC.1